MHLDIFSWLEAANLFLVDHISKDKFSGTFCVWKSCARCWWGNALIKKISEATRCTIMILDICLNGMVDRVDMSCYLIVRMKCSISGTCCFLDAQFRFMPGAVINLRSSSNSQSVCIYVKLKPLCMYNLCTCMVPSTMFSIFRFLIILPLANMIIRDMVLMKTITLMCMRSHQKVTQNYLSRRVWWTHVILTGSMCRILRCTVIPFRCDMLVP